MTKTDIQVIPLSEELAMPWDLTEWVKAADLRQWIADEVDTLNWSNPELVEYLRQQPSYQPRMLLCLLTYAYATGVYDSDDIVRRCGKDEHFHAISGDRLSVSGKFLVRFRRENRGLLKWCLVQVFKRALKAELGDCMLPAGMKRRLVDAAVGRLDMARQVDRGGEAL